MTGAVVTITASQVSLRHGGRTVDWPLGAELAALARGAEGAEGAGEFTRALEPEADSALRRDVGRRLYTGVFGGAPADSWPALVAAAAPENLLRVRLDIEDPVLATLPWELMHDDGQHALWRNGRVLLRRGRARGNPVAPGEENGADRGPLRALLVVCNPADHTLLADHELAKIGAALAQLPGRIHTEVVDGPSPTELRAELTAVRPHVLHFIGHGMRAVEGDLPGLDFNVEPQNGAKDERNEQRRWGAPAKGQWTLDRDMLEILLGDGRAPRLVLFNVCRQAGAPAGDFGSLVNVCLEQGVGAAVAMQGDIESPAAVEFSYELYRSLSCAKPIDEIITDVRNHLYLTDPGRPSWALPVLECAVPDPAEVTRQRWGHAEPELSSRNRKWPFDELPMFLGRAKERRTGWWHLCEGAREAAGPAERLLAITSGQPASGKTWQAKWCLLTCMLLGEDVTYADLAAQAGRGDGDDHKTLGWLSVLRSLRNACMDERQPDPMAAADFIRFNQVLNRATRGGPEWSRGVETDGEDQNYPFNPEEGRADDRRMAIFQEFLTTLKNRAAARQRPHLLALDHAECVIDSDVGGVLKPLLFDPVRKVAQPPEQFPVRILVVASQSWRGFKHLQDVMPVSPVVLGDFPPHEYRRLSREFWERTVVARPALRELNFEAFEEIATALRRDAEGPFPIHVFQKIVNLLLTMKATQTRS
ncbi:CHAT domain-containing protein [Streptomyces sp. A7024]|uniref:CHAT domain-containing protein n=1 Tax=Streptomyces coryli TaxID=1128680 RepID=A0A6G4U1D0_9ACTN|nr:CHAT domain-containing protein [Streptomyces coryli]NGN65802.1 CHAT domain-containing protein [Streptomyces coryli]